MADLRTDKKLPSHLDIESLDANHACAPVMDGLSSCVCQRLASICGVHSPFSKTVRSRRVSLPVGMLLGRKFLVLSQAAGSTIKGRVVWVITAGHPVQVQHWYRLRQALLGQQRGLPASLLAR